MNQPSNPLNALRLRRDVLPNIALMWLAKDSLNRVESAQGRYQRYLCLASITFAALSLEAFLNVVGASLVKCWEDVEGTASPAGKLAVIENSIGFSVDRSRIPFNAFRELFKFRNSIVHAKPDYLPITLTPDIDFPIPSAQGKTFSAQGKTPLTAWEKEASIENARRLVSRAENMIDILTKQVGIKLPGDDHSITKVWLDGKEWVKDR